MTASTVYSGPTAEDLTHLPAALQTRNQWVLWRGADKVDKSTGEVKLTKIPIDPQTLRNADTTDPRTWGTFARCLAALPVALEEWETDDPSGYRGGGIGFVFTDEDPYVGIDLDRCVDPDTGTIAPWAQHHVGILASYTERTPSGTGLHILVAGVLPPHGRKKGQVEMYAYARFFTMSGWQVPGTPPTVEARQDALTAMHAAIFGPPLPQRPLTGSTLTLGDTTLLAQARAARNRTKFATLWAGDTTGYGSPSEADLALCCVLAFWTHDPAQLDRLFRQSGLMRDKWDAKRGVQTYGERTIAEALARQTEHYQPHAADAYARRQAYHIARYKAQIHADPYFGAPERRGTGITPATLVRKETTHHG